MTNEEAKRLYKAAVDSFQQRDYASALDLLEQLDAERPNSRHVNYHRALCLLELGRMEEADACYQKLVGRMDPDALADLARAIEVTKTPRRTSLGSSSFLRKKAESAAVMSDTQQGRDQGELEETASAPSEDDYNVFVVQTSHSVSLNECCVMGSVKKGVVHVGETAHIIAPDGAAIPTEIVRIGPAETPINLAREGQCVMMLLHVESAQVGPGTNIMVEARHSADSTANRSGGFPAPKSAAVMDRPVELVAIERLIKQADYATAQDTLQAYLRTHGESIPAKRLLAQVYLDSDPPLRNPSEALTLIQSAFRSGGGDDPAVTHLLAQAQAENGETILGLRYLEKLYDATEDTEARQAVAQRIHAFRGKYALGAIWEFADAFGEVIYETSEISEAVKAIKNGAVPKTALCRRNHVGNWDPIPAVLSPLSPEIASLFAPQRKTWSPAFIALLFLLALALLGAIFLL